MSRSQNAPPHRAFAARGSAHARHPRRWIACHSGPAGRRCVSVAEPVAVIVVAGMAACLASSAKPFRRAACPLSRLQQRGQIHALDAPLATDLPSAMPATWWPQQVKPAFLSAPFFTACWVRRNNSRHETVCGRCLASLPQERSCRLGILSQPCLRACATTFKKRGRGLPCACCAMQIDLRQA